MIVLTKGSDNVVSGYIRNKELLNDVSGLTAIIQQLNKKVVISSASAFEYDEEIGAIAVKITKSDIASLTPMDPNSLYTTVKTTLELKGTNVNVGTWTTGQMIIWIADGYSAS